MADNHKRRATAKGILRQLSGKTIESNIIKAVDKVVIMEYLLQCPAEEVIEYNKNTMPTLVVECAIMVITSQIADYMAVIEACSKMAREQVRLWI